MDIREISTILIEPVDELPFEMNRIAYQSAGPSAPRRTLQSLQRRSPRATYARPRPPSRSISGTPIPETKAVRRSLTTEPLVRQYQPDVPTILTTQRISPAVTQQTTPVAQKSSGISTYLLLSMLLLIGVLGGIGFGYLLSTSQSLPTQISFPLAHHLIDTHINFLRVGY